MSGGGKMNKENYWGGMSSTEQAFNLIDMLVSDEGLDVQAINEHLKNISLNWDFLSTFTYESHIFFKKDEAHSYAIRKLDKDPKQLAKAKIIKEYWIQKNQFKRRGYSAQFISEMHKKYPIITSQKTIERLVATLNKENDQIPTKPAKSPVS